MPRTKWKLLRFWLYLKSGVLTFLVGGAVSLITMFVVYRFGFDKMLEPKPKTAPTHSVSKVPSQ